MLKIIILTQQDRFYIPKNIQKIVDYAKVLKIINIEDKNSLTKKVLDFYRWFGIIQVAKIGIFEIDHIIKAKIDKIFNYRLFKGLYGIECIAKKNNIPYEVTKLINNEKIYKNIDLLDPDIILSFSAPQIIKEPLLSRPKYGILNVHGSLLPDYRGCLPSFWYLYNNEKVGGATVHFMSSKIDDGDIVLQKKVNIADCASMFKIIEKTKNIGGDLMIEAIAKIENGTLVRKKNIAQEGRYFSWPTKNEGKLFRKMKKRFI